MNKESNNTIGQSLSRAEQDKLNYALAELFFGLARSNWVRGGSLGTARQKALDQMGSFLKSKNSNNPAVQYLYKTYMINKTKWAKVIMTSKKSENEISAPKENLSKGTAWGAKWVNRALAKLNGKIKEFESCASACDKPAAVVIEMQNAELANDRVQKLIQLQIQKIFENSKAA
ncbi:MAG: hypothetical protein LBF28_01545 [Rickettsiales bacterium]|jgi:hypothetical protein|nr:hypothetical protein [Rickettsiales bacterium]